MYKEDEQLPDDDLMSLILGQTTKEEAGVFLGQVRGLSGFLKDRLQEIANGTD